jgi:alpha-ketoglutarate-dependent taurine dioxygenase
MTAAAFSIDPLTPAIGAEISGLDLSKPLDSETLDAAFAESFGEIDKPHPIYPHAEGHPNVVLLKHGPDHKPDTNEWHTDLTFYQEPPFASILYAVEVPASGGDTLWANMVASPLTTPCRRRSRATSTGSRRFTTWATSATTSWRPAGSRASTGPWRAKARRSIPWRRAIR